MTSHHPYYRRSLPAKQYATASESAGKTVELGLAWPLPPGDPGVTARQLFDYRAAAAISSATAITGSGDSGPPQIWPMIGRASSHEHEPSKPWFHDKDLLELQWYGDRAPTIYLARSKCLALLAYADYFPDHVYSGRGLRSMVSRAVLAASPGWCGTFSPGVDGLPSLGDSTGGDYDMNQMFLLPIAYRHYDDLSPAAREHLITELLRHGRIHRPRKDDTFTSGRNPNDWARAGFVSPLGYHVDIGETENHILMIVTTRYLTNQLLYQREPITDFDNRRNGGDDYPSCMSLLLSLLRRIVRGDFSEYNAKSYQSETRWALLNLCTYAYDHEVRLGARMALDYLSAHMAVSSNDLRRLIPFRRRNEDRNSAHSADGYMTVGLLSWKDGADPAGPYFAMQAGNLRAYQRRGLGRGLPRCEIEDTGTDLSIEVLTDYRLPRSIHDLFVNDLHRRYFQRLHRTWRDEVGGNRNCDNMEIYAGSPSYLITAGGAPALWAINPGLHALIDGDQEAQQFGVAVTTSFMATGSNAGSAAEIIQFGEFSKKTVYTSNWKILGQEIRETNVAVLKSVANYGVAPDFACGHQVWLPAWVDSTVSEDLDGNPVDPHAVRGFSFVNLGRTSGRWREPGFFLAIYQETPGGLALLEAHDTWRNQDLTFEDFKAGAYARNAQLSLQSNNVGHYTTSNSNEIDFVIWKGGDGEHGSESGAEVLAVRYGDKDRVDSFGDADQKLAMLVNGTIMNSPADAVVEITNPALESTITLDFSDEAHPRRRDSQTGENEVSGFNNEVWVDFDYSGPMEGDVCRPFNTIAGAADAVADGGVIRVVPGMTRERGIIGGAKRFTLVAPIGGVSVGAARVEPMISAGDSGDITNHDVWVQFNWQDTMFTHPPYLFNTLTEAVGAVADGGTVHIQPGRIRERGILGRGKRCVLVAPIGGVSILPYL